MRVALAIDFGSTYTKLVAVDCDGEALLGVVQSPTTVAGGVMAGLDRALRQLEQLGVRRNDIGARVASSSAAGGLRMVAIGLVPDLTAEAARRAALGAGAKVLRVFAYELSRRDIAELAGIGPDMVLLAGGTDGGDRKTILRNAAVLAEAQLRAPVVVAGNRAVQDEVEDILTRAGCAATVVDNVLPELGRLNVEPARAAIRQIFMDRITHAKGLAGAEAFVGRIVMPTPMAVLEGANLLAAGAPGEPGLGELVVVDVGGATTDVHSVAAGTPASPGLVQRGLPEPHAKRTVEGDLGIRFNAPAIVETVGAERIHAALGRAVPPETVSAAVRHLSEETSHVPREPWEHELDAVLARAATAIAVGRHAGRVETVYTPTGPVQLLHGKDLSAVGAVIGTGGVFAYGRHARRVLEGARFDPEDPTSLRPRDPTCLVDARYILFAVGLLAPLAARAVVRIAKRHLANALATDAETSLIR